MYHIKRDLRAEKSSELLYQRILECLKVKNFDKITISDITKASTVSRATFYRNFDHIIDILYWKCDQMFHNVLSSYIDSNPDLSESDGLIRYVFSYWMNDTIILELLINQNRIDIIFNSFMKNADIVMDYIYEKTNLSTLDYKYFISSRVGIFVGIFQTWIRNGKKENLDQLVKILNHQALAVSKTGFIF